MSETAPAGPVLPAETLDPTTLTDEELKQRLQIQTADMSHGVVENARDKAHETLHRETTGEIEGRNRFVRFAKRVKRAVWDANLKRDYTVLTEQVEGRREITREGNIHALHGGTKEDHDRTASAVLDRVTSGFIHHGETQQEMKQVRNGTLLQDGLSKLVTEFAEGKIEIDVLVEKKDRLVGRFSHGLREAERLKGLLIADNVVDVARNARAARDHGVGMDRIQAAMTARHAEVQMGARTEVRRNAAEKAAEWLYRRKAGTLVNETTIAAAVAVTAVATKFAVRKGASAVGNVTRAATFGLVNAGVGVTAYVRESLHVKQDAQTHAREMALGGEDELTTAGKYREELEETRIKGVSFQELMDNLEAAKASAGSSKDELQAALATLTEARLRINLSDEEKVDLITWSSRLKADIERKELDMKLAETRAEVQKALESADTSTLSAVGIDILKKDARDVGAVMEDRSHDVEDQLLEPVDAHDEAVKKLARRKALKAGVTAMVTGDIVGMALQEVQGAVSDSVQGVFEKNDGQDRRTMLAGIFRTDEHNPGAAPNADNMTTVGQHAAFVPPEGYNLQHVDGKWELFDSHNTVVDSNVTFDSDGRLSEVSQHALSEKGFHFSEQSQMIKDPNALAHHDVVQSPHDYIKSHPHEFTQMHRTEWMANNTEKPDLNEQRVGWGGVDGTGVDAHGNYVLSVARMTADGSYEGGLSDNARQLMEQGKLKIALSMTEGTQSHVVMVDVDKHGHALIEKGSLAAKVMFNRHDGRVHFTGAYAEAVALGDKQPNGTQNVHVLATVIGENKPNTHALIDHQPVIQHGHEQIITSMTAPETTAPIEMPLVLPVRGRKGLEYAEPSDALRAVDQINPGDGKLYYSGRTLEELRAWIEHDRSRLKTRREITNPDGTKSWVEADGLPVERNVQRERDAIQKYLQGQEQNNPVHYEQVKRIADFMPPMDDNCRVAINVPAWMEANNLTHFLEQFSSQVDDKGNPLDPSLFEIDVLVNRKTGAAPDDSVAVIEKFIADFEAKNGVKPAVRYYDVEIDPPFNNVGYARKLLADATMLRSLRRSNQKEALYIETEDADINRADPRTVYNLVNKLDNNPHLDAVRGVADRDPTYLMQNDMLFLRRRIWDFSEILARRKELRDPRMPGWNYTWNRNWLNGWNSGFTAEGYALIDGYDPATVGEDMIIGEKLTMIRGDGKYPNLEVVGKVGTRSDGSPRRFITEISRQKQAYAPGQFEDEDLNKEIREKSTQELLDDISDYARITPENEESFSNLIRSYRDYINDTTPDKAAADQTMRRVMFWLGFEKDDYELKNGQMTVKSWDNVKLALDNYRTRYEAKALALAA